MDDLAFGTRNKRGDWTPHATVKLPGTIILITIFFASFVLYYFVNWKYLSEIWLLR